MTLASDFYGMLKIKTTGQALDRAPKEYVRLRIAENTTARFVEQSGKTELVISVPKLKNIESRKLRLLFREAVGAARAHKIAKLAIELDLGLFPAQRERDEAWLYATAVENFSLAHYEFNRYKKSAVESPLEEILLCSVTRAAEKAGVARGATIGTYVNRCRDIANTPGGDMTPEILGTEAKNAVRGLPVTVTVLGKAQIERLKMGALLGVAKGTHHGPRFIVMEYWGAGKPARQRGKQRGRNIHEHNPIVFVGKGITFDTGGLNLKPSEAILNMHLDMSAGAAVIAAIACAAKLKLKKNIVGLIPAAENAVSDESMRPGDILTSMSGKTIEVANTDAEGRLVLADALTYAARYSPRLVVDVATLTGAALVALGEHASALMTKDRRLQETLLQLGEESGDYLWPLPLWDEYMKYTKGNFADIANIPVTGNARYGGAINGGTFLSHFAKGYPWAHIDMAPRMLSTQGDHLAKGATGEPTRLLIKIAEEY